MDQIMGSFANDFVPQFSEAELDAYEEVLQNSDPELYDWICRRLEVPVDKRSDILTQLLDYNYARKRSTGSDEAQLP